MTKADNQYQLITVAEGVILHVDKNAPAHFVPWPLKQTCKVCSEVYVFYSTMRRKSAEKWNTCSRCYGKARIEKKVVELPAPVLAAWQKARGGK